jgi:hypothetical protein
MGRFIKILNLLLVTIIVFFSVKLFYAFVIAQFDTGSPAEAFQTKLSSIKKGGINLYIMTITVQ